MEGQSAGKKFDLFSRNLFEAAVQYATCIHCELKIIAGKKLAILL